MNKDTDIQYLIKEYNTLMKNTEIEEKYKEAKKKLIGEVVKCSNIDFDKCEDILEDNPEIIIGLMKNIPAIETITNNYLKTLNEYNNYTDEIISVNTRLGMILRQITKKSFDRCVSAFHYDEELFVELLKYIDKLERC
jgi:hypothetical protein